MPNDDRRLCVPISCFGVVALLSVMFEHFVFLWTVCVKCVVPVKPRHVEVTLKLCMGANVDSLLKHI